MANRDTEHLAHAPRVLIVEDDELLCRIMRLTLARRGYTVADAYSVASAVESLEAAATVRTPFDLLLLDINLPDQTGWELMRRMGDGGHATSPAPLGPRRPSGMREELPGVQRVIVMTAVRPPECRMREFHPAGVLVKPFPIGALLQLIERVLHTAGQVGPAENAYSESGDAEAGLAAEASSAASTQAHTHDGRDTADAAHV